MDKTLYNQEVKHYALKLIQAEMKRDCITGTIWKSGESEALTRGIYSVLKGTQYYDLTLGKVADKTLKNILSHYNVQYGFYCIKLENKHEDN